ncbi:hypothetical protein [Paenibacillus sp. sgz500958]|uniref:hypothetical protein n=1 Tax=Paenibacillus sp. sgz500958 TaxID=3242475 RepID=UPI0036D3D459
MFNWLIVTYAILMGFAAVSQRSKLGTPLMSANFFFSCLLLLSSIHVLMAGAGLIGLIACTIKNGYVLHGRIHPLHLLIRCGISALLFAGVLLI